MNARAGAAGFSFIGPTAARFKMHNTLAGSKAYRAGFTAGVAATAAMLAEIMRQPIGPDDPICPKGKCLHRLCHVAHLVDFSRQTMDKIGARLWERDNPIYARAWDDDEPEPPELAPPGAPE